MLKSLKKQIKNIRECIWPLLEPLEEREPKQIKEEDCKWQHNELDFIFECIQEYKQDEENRRKDVESKSTIFIGTFGITITVLISLIKDIVLAEEPYSLLKLILIGTMVLAIIYLCRAIWFSIKALERRRYHSLCFPNFMLSETFDKKKRIIIENYNNIKKNQDEINIKVDYMTMAQEYFKRAVIVVGSFSFMLLVSYMLSYRVFSERLNSLLNFMNTKLFLIVCIIILIIVVLILIHNINKLKRHNFNE